MRNAGKGHCVSEIVVLSAEHDEHNTGVAGPDQDEVDGLGRRGRLNNGAGWDAVGAEKTQGRRMAHVADELKSYWVMKSLVRRRLCPRLVIRH